MALQIVPGFTGWIASRTSSFDKRALGKFTDSNHLESLHVNQPSDYDKKIISLYTQTHLWSNDLMQMIDKGTPYMLDGPTDAWQWEIEVPYKMPVITAIPDSTASNATPGINEETFQIVVDTNEFTIGDVLKVDRRYGQTWVVVAEFELHAAGYLYTCVLKGASASDYVDPVFLQEGREIEKINHMMGEFSTKFSGLGKEPEKIKLYETLSAEWGVEHSITDWADARQGFDRAMDKNGKPLDIQVYSYVQNFDPYSPKKSIMTQAWEPFIEMKMRQEMLNMRMKRAIWETGGTHKTGGTKPEIMKAPMGIYYQMRNNGNLVQYNRGELTSNLFRNVFGDLFYRREPMEQRNVKLYTNEAGMDAWEQMLLNDAKNSPITFVANVDGAVNGNGRNYTYNFAFNSMITRETGKIELVHLQELDQPLTNLEMGQNKKSTPIFICFDVSNSSNGLSANIRRVRRSSRPSMRWGYVDGAVHHLGFAKSQGMSSANKDPWYTIWMKDREDIFIEDLSKVVLIEEKPLF